MTESACHEGKKKTVCLPITAKCHLMWFETDDCGSVADNVVWESLNLVLRPPIKSLNVVQKIAISAVQTLDDCGLLHLSDILMPTV